MAVKLKSTITLVRVNDGATGKGVTKTEVFYYLSTSNTTQTGGSWVTTPPAWVDGRYYWQKIKTTFTDNSSSESKPVCITGGKGQTGSAGSTGKGVSSITTQFYLSTSKTTQTGGSWTDSMPTWTTGKYLWTRSKIMYINPSSTVYTAPICDSSWEAVNEIQVGGRNLIVDTNMQAGYAGENGELVSDELYKVTDYIPVSPEEHYILQIWLPTSTEIWFDDVYYKSDKTYLGGYDGERITTDHLVKEYVPPANSAYIRVSFTYKDTFKYKFEKGNKATDWTPAPEDVDSSIKDAQDAADSAGNKADNALSNSNEVRASLEILQGSIETLVTDQNGSSLMTQTGDGWTFNMGTYQTILDKATSDITDIKGDVDEVGKLANKTEQLANDIAAKTAYINMSTDETGAPCIELGKVDNEFKLRITNTSIDFMQGSQKIAYITNQSLYIQSSVVTDEMQIGEGTGFVWKKRTNGNMGLRYIG